MEVFVLLLIYLDVGFQEWDDFTPVCILTFLQEESSFLKTIIA